MPATLTGSGWLVDAIPRPLAAETHAGTTDGAGELAVTFGKPFAAVPCVSPTLSPPNPEAGIDLTVKSCTTTGCVVSAKRRDTAIVSLVTVLIPTFSPAASVEASLFVTGPR